MRAGIGVVGFFVVVVAAGFGIQLAFPWSSFTAAGIAGCVIAAPVALAAIWLGRIRWQLVGPTSSLLIATVMGTGVGGIVGVGAAMVMHINIAVYNGTRTTVTIAIDGHEVEAVDPDGTTEVVLPVSSSEIVAMDDATVIDRASLDVGGHGRLVYDVGGTSCFEIAKVEYVAETYKPTGDAPSLMPVRVGSAHVFRTDATYLWEIPHEIQGQNGRDIEWILLRGKCKEGTPR
jgi:hypothetical protein